jgi:hypothetical protein
MNPTQNIAPQGNVTLSRKRTVRVERHDPDVCVTIKMNKINVSRMVSTILGIPYFLVYFILCLHLRKQVCVILLLILMNKVIVESHLVSCQSPDLVFETAIRWLF